LAGNAWGTTLDFTRLVLDVEGQWERGLFFRGGRKWENTDFGEPRLFLSGRCRGCWGRPWVLWLRGKRFAGRFHRHVQDAGRTLFVCAGARFLPKRGRCLARIGYAGESLCAGHRKCAAICGATRVPWRVARADDAAALRTGGESPAVVAAVDGVFRGGC